MEQNYEKEISKRNTAINNLLRCMQNLVSKNKEFDEAHALYCNEIEKIRSQMSKSARELNQTFNNHAECISKAQELKEENEMLKRRISEQEHLFQIAVVPHHPHRRQVLGQSNQRRSPEFCCE